MMRLRSHILVPAVFCLSTAWCLAASPSLKEARDFFDQGRYPEAIESLKRIAGESTDTKERQEADHIAAWSNYNLGQKAIARAAFLAMATAPSHKHASGAAFMVARIDEEEGRPKDACLGYRNLLLQHPKSNSVAEAGFRLANAFHGLSPEDKIAVSQETGEILPAVLVESARIWLERKSDPANARALANDLIQMFPTSSRVPGAMVISGRACLASGETLEACRLFRDVRAKHPGSNAESEAMDRLGMACLTLSKADLKTLSASAADEAVVQEAVYAAGWTRLNKRSEYSEAANLFGFYMALWPSGPKWDDCLMLLGRSQIKRGLHEDALLTYKKLFDETDPNNHWNEAQAEVVRVLAEAKDWGRLKEESLNLYQHDHPRGKAYAVLSYVNACVALEEIKEAVAFLEKIMAENPDDPYLPYYQQRLREIKANCCGN